MRALPTRAVPLISWLVWSVLGCAPPPSVGLATSGTQALGPSPPGASSDRKPDPKRARSELYWGQRWCFDTGAPMSTPPALGPAGEVYVATHEGYVHALTSEGGFAWSYTVKGAVIGGPVVGAGGTVLVATRLNLLYALRPDGSRLWVFHSPEPISSPLAVSERGTAVFVAKGRVVYAVSSRGGVLWRVPLGSEATTGPVIHENGSVFIGTKAGVETWVSPARRELWPSPPVDGFVAGGANEPGSQHWLASGRLFSSNGAVTNALSLTFARFTKQSVLAVTDSRLLELTPDGTERVQIDLEVAPSAPPVPGPERDTFVPLVDGSIARVREWRRVESYAKLGFSPVASLVLDSARDRMLAGVGEGRVCAISLTRGAGSKAR